MAPEEAGGRRGVLSHNDDVGGRLIRTRKPPAIWDLSKGGGEIDSDVVR